MLCHSYRLKCLFFVLLFAAISSAANQTLGDIYPLLANLGPNPPGGLRPSLGGRNVAWCCNLAVNQSLEVQNGSLAFVPGQTFIHGDLATLQRFGYPCTRSYTPGKPLDKAQVWVDWNWCSSNCPGWQLTKSTDLGEWARPFVSFIAPSAVFAVNIPRRRRIQVPPWLLFRNLGSFYAVLALLIKVPLASIVVTLDIVLWLLILITLSGPMCLSGLYEALLDWRVLHYLDRRVKVNSMSLRERTHLLLVVLLGNLDLQPAWDDCERIIAPLSNESLRRKSTGTTPILPQTQTAPPTLAVPDLVSAHTSTLNSQSSTPLASTSTSVADQTSAGTILHDVNSVKSKLKSMLESQVGFGSAVGAAIVFYSASFIYSVVESQSLFGSSRPAHTIAFGTFWMIIPHVAIVSSFLLAGNNPNIWASITGHIELPEKSEPSKTWSTKLIAFIPGLWEYTFHRAAYRPAWLWNRGPCKAMWIAKFAEKNPRLAPLINKEIQNLGLEGWALSTFGSALFLIVLPCFLAGMISYTTPAIGLSCRSMTFLTYAAAQTLLMLLCIVDWVFWRRDRAGVVASSPRSIAWWSNFPWYFVWAITVIFAAFIGIFGTVFWLMGAYRNCYCLVPIQYWWYRSGRDAAATTTAMGGADTLSVEMARKYWLPVGVTATAFMLFVTYIGWFHQRRLRGHFQYLVTKIDGINEADYDENADYDD